MLRTNIVGAIIIICLVFFLIGFGMSLKIDLNWEQYFKILGIVAGIALIISVITHIIPSKN